MSEGLTLPALADVVQPNGSKICPVMGAQVLMMPSISSSMLTPQSGQGVFVRHFAPCVGNACQWWDEKAKDCKIALAAAVIVDQAIGGKS